ncbi:MAG TPA: nuclear transport factor 2 family protein [Albitalea sp.]|nr:nuclear transport factor 2 family protein [Albitalea sp.]
MSRAKSPQAPLASPDDIEHQFYEALQHGDIEKLMAVWSDDDDIACVHPGGPRVIGAAAIRASFDAMFANGAVNAHPEKVRRVQTLSSAVHSVLERVQVMTKDGPQSAWVVATNVYVKTGLGWRLVAHHASPGTPREVQEVVEAAGILH